MRTASFIMGGVFTIEAEGWPSEETASPVIIALQTWAMELRVVETAALHDVLSGEREALVFDLDYDRNAVSLPTVREAQRQAMRSGYGWNGYEIRGTTVTLEALQTSSTTARSG